MVVVVFPQLFHFVRNVILAVTCAAGLPASLCLFFSLLEAVCMGHGAVKDTLQGGNRAQTGGIKRDSVCHRERVWHAKTL